MADMLTHILNCSEKFYFDLLPHDCPSFAKLFIDSTTPPASSGADGGLASVYGKIPSTYSLFYGQYMCARSWGRVLFAAKHPGIVTKAFL